MAINQHSIFTPNIAEHYSAFTGLKTPVSCHNGILSDKAAIETTRPLNTVEQ